ncbi:MAG: cell division protein FtsZ [Chitinophagales bacterium]
MTNLQFDLPKDQSSIIKVIGVGGGGSNAVNHMFNQGIIGVNFVVCNTDSQAIDLSRVPNKIQLGPKLTQGLGAGSNPDCGMQATEESIEEVREILAKNTKMVFVTAGMGGGTGTGGAPVVARIAKEMGILTVGIVTTPFSFEGKRKYNQALEGIERLKAHVDTILVISNDKIREMYGNARQSDAFNHANNILASAAKSISEIITVPGYINVDFADVKHVMTNGGAAVMGSAVAEGENRALNAVKAALNSPLLNDNDIRGAKKILVNISSGSEQVTIDEITEINEYIQEVAKDTDIIFGTCDDENLGQKISVTLIATGFEATYKPAYLTPVNRVVRELDEVKPTTVSAPVAEVVKVEAPKANVLLLDEEEVKPLETAQEQVLETPLAKTETTVETPLLAEEESYSLFSMLSNEEETTRENVVVFEFETPEKTNEEVVEMPSIEALTAAAEQSTSELEKLKGEEKEEEVFEVFKVKSYEHSNTVSNTKPTQEQVLQDRKKILANLSFRSLNKSKMSELESVPAYMRKGVEVNSSMPSEQTEMSRFSIGQDYSTGRPEMRRDNRHLHDNVD